MYDAILAEPADTPIQGGEGAEQRAPEQAADERAGERAVEETVGAGQE